MKLLSRTLFIGLCLAALIAGFYLSGGSQKSPPDMSGLLWPDTRKLQAFKLVDDHGASFDLQALEGQWSFIFFGFTHCPDICPVTLQTMSNADKLIRKQTAFGETTGYIFVSVDPERDTPEKLNAYVGYFGKEFTGVTGDIAQIEALTTQLGIVHIKNPPDDRGNYSVDHSAVIILTNPQAEFVAVFGAPHKAEEIARQYIELREFFQG